MKGKVRGRKRKGQEERKEAAGHAAPHVHWVSCQREMQEVQSEMAWVKNLPDTLRDWPCQAGLAPQVALWHCLGATR